MGTIEALALHPKNMKVSCRIVDVDGDTFSLMRPPPTSKKSINLLIYYAQNFARGVG
jgi:hypothetical protein